MINYIIQVVLAQLLFLMVYDFFLSKETFFQKNRWYLLSSVVISFLLPLVKIEKIQDVVSQTDVILLPEVVLSPEKVIRQAQWYENIDTIELFFWMGLVLFLALFLFKLISIFRLILTNEIQKKDSYSLVLIPRNAKAFSFFNYIFLGKDVSKIHQEKIIRHELVHSKQKHSIDLLFFEILKIVMWFNPLLYVYQKRIALIHEFLSDGVVIKEHEKSSYINSLLYEVFHVENISFINQFYKQSLIKKRIMMLTKNQSKGILQFKYLLLLPVLLTMVLYSSCVNEQEDLSFKRQQTRYLKLTDNTSVKKESFETYLDLYIGFQKPDSNWEQISEKELSSEEVKEYEFIKTKEQGNCSGKNSSVYLYKKEDGRKVVAFVFGLKEIIQKQKLSKDDAVGFSFLDVFPKFPECPDGDKDCFTQSISKLVAKNFNAKLIEGLGLKQGKHRVFVQFTIDENGKVVNVKSRAPHPKLNEEAERVVNLLPKLVPGQKDGKVVKVKYTLPIMLSNVN